MKSATVRVLTLVESAKAVHRAPWPPGPLYQHRTGSRRAKGLLLEGAGKAVALGDSDFD